MIFIMYFNIYHINQFKIQIHTQKHLFFHDWINKLNIRTPEHCLKLERWQGPPNINKVKQYEIVLSFKVSLYNQFIHSWKWRQFVYLVCLGIKESVSEDRSLIITISSPKLRCAPFKNTHTETHTLICRPSPVTWIHPELTLYLLNSVTFKSLHKWHTHTHTHTHTHIHTHTHHLICKNPPTNNSHMCVRFRGLHHAVFKALTSYL